MRIFSSIWKRSAAPAFPNCRPINTSARASPLVTKVPSPSLSKARAKLTTEPHSRSLSRAHSRLGALVAAAALALAALLLPTASAAAACPNIGLERQRVSFITASGTHRYTVEIAASPQEQSCGLMFREFMPKSIGMIFPFKTPRDTAFWMRNTPLPLDIIFIDKAGRVISVGQGKPYSEDFIPAGGVAAHVVELNQGEAARIGLKKGDTVKID
jgi:hypothetical protein